MPQNLVDNYLVFYHADNPHNSLALGTSWRVNLIYFLNQASPIPIYLAFEFLLSKLKPLGAKIGKVPSLPGLPNSMMGKKGDLYTSLANFFCPEDCPEPAQYCTATKKGAQSLFIKFLMIWKGTLNQE